MKKKVFVSREIFTEVLAFLSSRFEVQANQEDRVLTADDLAEALSSGVIAGAGLDVFEGEPSLHPGLRKLTNVVMTPHIASSSEKTRFKMAMKAAENLVAALTTGNPPNLLNPSIKQARAKPVQR